MTGAFYFESEASFRMAQDSARGTANRLARETSPYLQQHAHNPVDWYPWGEEAFERARAERKPILLSIGYAACHWCHVMAHESFEDEETARLMNELFVNIKVDREERPDIDRIHQIALQVLTQRAGGWPLTMFLTHDDRMPFFGGTYFPKEARYGMPAFRDVLRKVAEFYREHEADLRRQNESLREVFAEIDPAPAHDVQLSAEPIRVCRARLEQSFDREFGGFGGAPKFPHANQIERLLRDWHATAQGPEPDLHALYMATLTLRRMGEGGLFDQVGGGFCRYSVDAYWMIPHFEKMLYDNALLLPVYAQAAVATGDSFYARIANRTADWALREMLAPEGGFYSSLDADSEGHEGRFYVWDREEIRQALSDEEYTVFAPRFGLDREPNFEGRWHLHAFRSLESIAEETGRSVEQIESLIDAARAKLFQLRERRVRPGRDEKILTSWNALMIRGLAIAARSLARDELAEAATRALEFIRRTLWRDGRLRATYRDGRARLNAYLDDYVFLADAILELQQVRFRADELAFACELIEAVRKHFADERSGGFYFTSDDHEALIHRSKALGDDATPSGNGVAAQVLLRMGWLLGRSDWLQDAERTLRAAWSAVEKYPHAHVSLLTALEELLEPPQIVIVRGPEEEIERWRRELAKLYAPRRLVLAIPADATGLPEALAEKAPRDRTVAYVCRGSTCSAPVDSLGTLVRDLRLALERT